MSVTLSIGPASSSVQSRTAHSRTPHSRTPLRSRP
jgi:hypothetical protein